MAYIHYYTPAGGKIKAKRIDTGKEYTFSGQGSFDTNQYQIISGQEIYLLLLHSNKLQLQLNLLISNHSNLYINHLLHLQPKNTSSTIKKEEVMVLQVRHLMLINGQHKQDIQHNLLNPQP